MATEIRTLFDAADPTLQIVPRTTVAAITDENNIPLSARLAEDVYVTVLTHIYNDQGHQLLGLGNHTGLVLCVFTAAADYVSTDTITLDGVSYIFKKADGSNLSGTVFANSSIVFGIVNTAANSFHLIATGQSIEDHNTDETAHQDIREAIPTIFSSTSEPTANDGKDGDIWVVVES